MGTVASSASLLGFEDQKLKGTPSRPELGRQLSLSTIHEERTSQMYDTAGDQSITLADHGEVSFSFDGKEVSVSLYETPDLTEDEAIQIVEMYAEQLSEHFSGKKRFVALNNQPNLRYYFFRTQYSRITTIEVCERVFTIRKSPYGSRFGRRIRRLLPYRRRRS